jgi:hypothetical protein
VQNGAKNVQSDFSSLSFCISVSLSLSLLSLSTHQLLLCTAGGGEVVDEHGHDLQREQEGTSKVARVSE